MKSRQWTLGLLLLIVLIVYVATLVEEGIARPSEPAANFPVGDGIARPNEAAADFPVGDNLVLLGFAVLPLALATMLRFVFRRLKLRESRGAARLILGNFLVFLVFCSVILIVAEVYFRFFADGSDSFGMSKVASHWSRRHVHVNEAGVRDSIEYSRGLQPGHRRITFIGDSFAFGDGVPDVEDRFANRIRAKHRDIDVHCFAHPGLDTGEHLKMIEHLGGKQSDVDFAFDVVVLVYVLNDVDDILPEKIEMEGQFESRYRPGFLCSHSFFLNLLYFRCVVAQDPDFRDYDHLVVKGYDGYVWWVQQMRLRQMRDTVESLGGVFVVVTFPYLHELGADNRFRPAHQRLGEFWSSLGVRHLDLLEEFESHDPEELVVSAYDAHPNEKAHAIAAKAIAPFVVDALRATSPRDAK